MKDDKQPLTVAQALSVLKVSEDDEVHTFTNPGAGMLIGADWAYDTCRREMVRASVVELAGVAAREMKHGVAMTSKVGRTVFFETDEEKLLALEKTL